MPLVVRPLRRRRSLLLVASALVLSSVFVGSFLVGERTSALPASFYSDADPRPNRSIAVVGDSLTFAYFEGLPEVFARKKWGPFQLEVRSARRTTIASSIATSGLDAVRRIRAGGFDPLVWIIALGTNDMRVTYGTPGAAAALIDTMMAEIGADADVVWVNVYQRDFPAETAAFNAALRVAATRHPSLVIADWHAVIAANPQWLAADGVHLDLAGSIARNEFVARAALEPGCESEPPSASPSAPIVVGAAGASAAAERLCHR